MKSTITVEFDTQVVKPLDGTSDQASGFVAILTEAGVPLVGFTPVPVDPTAKTFDIVLEDQPGTYQVSIASLDVNGALVSPAALSPEFVIPAGVLVPFNITVKVA